MGYSTVKDRSGAVAAAASMARLPAAESDWSAAMPLLADQVQAEAGVCEPRIAALALEQAAGDAARAVSLVRPWASVLPRLGTARASTTDVRPERRVTPGFGSPAGGQFLGASLDYAERLLKLGDHGQSKDGSGNGVAGAGLAPASTALPDHFQPALDSLSAEDLVAPPAPAAVPEDITRQAVPRTSRGALLQLLARSETGALTAIAYSAIRGYGAFQDPTLAELTAGRLPVVIERPDGASFEVGEITITMADVVLYRLHDGTPDPRLTRGFGATLGRLERRAIAAAVLDASCARAAGDDPLRRSPSEDPEFIALTLDGQEATGFVEHLKLPHHVTFASELDRIREARARGEGS